MHVGGPLAMQMPLQGVLPFYDKYVSKGLRIITSFSTQAHDVEPDSLANRCVEGGAIAVHVSCTINGMSKRNMGGDRNASPSKIDKE